MTSSGPYNPNATNSKAQEKEQGKEQRKEPSNPTTTATATVVIELPPMDPTTHTQPQPSSSTATNSSSISNLLFPNGIASLTVTIPPSTTSRRTKSRLRSPHSQDRPPQPETTTTTTAPRRPPPKSRWRTPEFVVYYVAFVLVVPKMFGVVMRLSQDTHPNYRLYEHKLSQGWMFGRKIDESDSQYHQFRSGLPPLFILSLTYLALTKLSSSLSNPTTSTSTASNLTKRTRTILPLCLAILTLLHGSSTPFILSILSVNYIISKSFTPASPSAYGPNSSSSSVSGWKRYEGWLVPALLWSWNLGVLVGIEVLDGGRWESLGMGLDFLDSPRMRGLMPRWHVTFNITMLRLLSFGMDYRRSLARSGGAGEETGVDGLEGDNKGQGPTTTNRSERDKNDPSPGEYTFVNYLTYAFYPPLYIAGPIMAFDDFLTQLKSPRTIPTRSIVSYAIRFAFCLLTMEWILHNLYVVAIKDTRTWGGLDPFELSMVGFWNLIIVWLKLLIPWRFFRLWALADGIDPPENMVRCMANNYSTLGFWRSWHRSYNLWLLKYIYIPLGGSSNPIPSTLLVFTFVAIWHDLSLTLLTWGWLISLFVIPEILARKLTVRWEGRWWYRHLCAVGGVGNVLMMMTGNLVGFVVGLDGCRYMWGRLVGSFEGVKFMVGACMCLFIGIQIMFEYREEELRRGIVRKC